MAPTESPNVFEDLSDAEILARFDEGQRLPADDHPFAEHSVRLITDNTVGKISQDSDEDIGFPSEAFVLDVVAKHTTIPVPRVRRVIKRKWDFLIVMDRIQGRQLSTVWPTMSDGQKSDVARQLKGYVEQLRAVNVPQRAIPGPLDRDLQPRTCFSPPVWGQIIDSRGPFESYAALAAFFEERRQKMIQFSGSESIPDYMGIIAQNARDIPPFDASHPLVLTHQDLNPRNLIVQDDGTLALVDWSWAGFYPVWWETVAMKAQAENEEIVQKKSDSSWTAIIGEVCGEYPKMDSWLSRIGASLSWR